MVVSTYRKCGSECRKCGSQSPDSWLKGSRNTQMSPTQYRKEKKEAENKVNKQYLSQIEMLLNKE